MYHVVLMTYAWTNRQARWLELLDAEGNLERPLLADQWLAPGSSLTVRDGHLDLDAKAWNGSYQVVRAEPPMLEQFVRLASTGQNADEAVLRYARRWGVLDLCDHQLPWGHEWQVQLPISFATTAGGISTFATDVECRSLAGAEPIVTWMYWSRQAAALLSILGRLRRSEPGAPEDWAVLREEAPWVAQETAYDGLTSLRESASLWTDRLVGGDVPVNTQRDVASGAVEAWLRLANVSLELRWPQGVPEVGFRSGGLLGALGLQIMLAAVDSSGWLLCPECGSLHAPPRTRNRRRSYCEQCRSTKVPQQQASRRSRAKKAGNAAFRESERLRVKEWRRRQAEARASTADRL